MNCAAVISSSYLDEIREQLFCGVLVCRAATDLRHSEVLEANSSFFQMSGLDPTQVLHRSLDVFAGTGIDEILATVVDAPHGCPATYTGTSLCYRPDRTPYYVEWRLSAMDRAGDEARHWVLVQQDITDRVRAEQDRQVLRAAIDAARWPVLITDSDANVVVANRAFAQWSGRSADQLVGSNCHDLHEEPDFRRFVAPVLVAARQGEGVHATFIERRQSDQLVCAEQHVALIASSDDKTHHLVVFSQDITETVADQRQLQWQATHDHLTGALNRHAGRALLDRSCQTHSAGQPVALILCDVDGFKSVNDRYGHPVGDRVLARLAQSLLEIVRTSDTVIRWGGEEFLILLRGQSLEGARLLAERIRSHIATLPDPEVGKITLSLGVGVRGFGENSTSLVARADRALYAAKHAGRNRVELAAPYAVFCQPDSQR